jgi:putative glutamine amidotransferase
VVPFAIGPDLNLLSRIGPAIRWVAAALALLLGLDRLFQAEREDGPASHNETSRNWRCGAPAEMTGRLRPVYEVRGREQRLRSYVFFGFGTPQVSERECQMHRKPLIGINAEFRSAKKDSPAFSYLPSGYYDAIVAAGGIPVIVPPLATAEDVGAILETLQGFVLVGGPDLDPRRDGYMLHPSVRAMEPRRETFDRLLMSQIADRRLPVFGIGVGMQLLNVSQGGNLFLHLSEDLPSAIPHKDTQDPSHRHGLEVAVGSLMERVYGDGEIRVNSMHHMAIDEVASGFVVTARCPDGVIEAIESDVEDWFAIGTQLPRSPLSYRGQILKINWLVSLRIFLTNDSEFKFEFPFRVVGSPEHA